MNVAEYVTRAVACNERGDYDSAVADYTEAINLNSDNAQAASLLFFRGCSLYRKKDFGRAIEDFTGSIKLSMNDADAASTHISRGMVYLDLDNNSAALKDIEEAVKLDPANENYRLLLENIRAEMGIG